MTDEDREEVILRARAAARNGHSLAANPYDPQAQPDHWQLWRLAFTDATPDQDDEAPAA